MLQNLKVLYVEDEEFTRQQMSKLLKRRVGKVIVAENGKEGLELYNQHKPDIIIADLIMPVMGGLEMIKNIREVDQESFIVITTASGDPDSILRTVNVGINKYLIKPLDADKLTAVLEDISSIKTIQSKSDVVIDEERKKEFENRIKKAFSFYIKKATGKGPRDVSAFIRGNQIEIKAYEVLTAFEKSLMESESNTKYVEMNRKLFYSIQQTKIEAIISDIIERKVHVNKFTTNIHLDMDNLEILIL